MKVSRKITVDRREREVLDKFFDMCNKLGLEPYDLVDLLNAISNKDSEFDWVGDTCDIEYTD